MAASIEDIIRFDCNLLIKKGECVDLPKVTLIISFLLGERTVPVDIEDLQLHLEVAETDCKDDYLEVVELFKDLEADDIVCALQNEHTYIMSQDKDQRQKPGFHYDWSKNIIRKITNAEALHFICWQMLKGDSGDNIGGMPGCGKVGANKALESIKPSDMLPMILNMYQKKFGIFVGTDMFTEMWQLLKMRENRGKYFQEKYKLMFETRDYAINKLKNK